MDVLLRWTGWYEIAWGRRWGKGGDGIGWDGMERDGMGWNGMGWGGMGWILACGRVIIGVARLEGLVRPAYM